MQNKKNVLEASAWLMAALLLTGIFSIEMSIINACIRSAWTLIFIALVHYGNKSLFNRTLALNNKIRYYVSALIFIVLLSFIRMIVEQNFLPAAIRPLIPSAHQLGIGFYLFTSTFFTAISTILLTWSFLANKERDLLLQINAGNEARLKSLQSQISPHFLFNALNTIYSFSLAKSDKTPDVLLKLTDLLRYSIYQQPGQQVPVWTEAQQIELLMELFSLRREEPYKITFDKEISDGMIEPMILIPLVENCLKHCDFDVNEDAYVRLYLHSNSDFIRFSTVNTFRSLKREKSENNSVGLKNIKERLGLVYGNQHTLSIATDENLFKVDLRIQWRK